MNKAFVPYTKGPWAIAPEGDVVYSTHSEAAVAAVKPVVDNLIIFDTSHADANARLIAAAPEMAMALSECLASMKRRGQELLIEWTQTGCAKAEAELDALSRKVESIEKILRKAGIDP